MDRPALQRLLDDIRAGKVDVVVVYKVDRLTRSLADFAKIVEVFDAQGVSFVSVTQAFNTTTSMGRLTLNVLLSFAQFEREVTGERIRDKIAASKKKGMWMGGQPALGYDVKERKLVVNEAEAETVRGIFRRYLELGAVRALRDDLAAAGVVSKRRTAADGSPYGGQRFSRGALYLMLKNRIYRGEIVHKGKAFPGEHAAIVDEDLWRRVQSHLEENRMERREGDKALEPSLLAGIVFDASSEPMTPTHAVKKGTRYRYYISRRLITGPASDSSRGQRVPASNLEALVIGRLRALLADPVEILNAIANGERDAPMQKRLRDAAAALSARWEHLPTETQHDLARSILVRAQVHADRIDLDVGSARLVSWLLNKGGDEGDRRTESSVERERGWLRRNSDQAQHSREPEANRQRDEVHRRGRREFRPGGYDLDPTARARSEDRQANVRAELSAARGRRARGKDHGFLCDARLCGWPFSPPILSPRSWRESNRLALTANKLMADTRLPLNWRDQRAALGFA